MSELKYEIYQKSETDTVSVLLKYGKMTVSPFIFTHI